MSDTIEQHLERNYEAFKKMDFPDDQTGRVALLRNEKLVEVFDERRDARKRGEELFSDGLFSIQEINPVPIRLPSRIRIPQIGHMARRDAGGAGAAKIDPERARELEEKYLAMMRGEVDVWELQNLPGGKSRIVFRPAKGSDGSGDTQAA